MKWRILLFPVLLSNILFAQTNDEIQKLQDFTKIYSVVRHFHPSDESAQLSWDAFTVYAVNEILKTKTENDFESKIKELFIPIAPSITFGTTKYKWEINGEKPIYWINSGLASGSISKSGTFMRKRSNEDSIKIKLTNVPQPKDSYTLRLSNNFIVNIPLIVYEKNGQTQPVGEIQKYADLKATAFDNRVAISNVIIMWSGLRHFYTYQDEINIDWDNILKKGLEESFKNKTQEDNFLTLRRFSHHFRDGHMYISYPEFTKKNSFLPPIKLKYLQKTNQVVISDLLFPHTDLKKGDVILYINNVNPIELINTSKLTFSGSEQYTTHLALKELLKGKENSTIVLKLDNGKKVELKRNFIAYQNPEFFSKDNNIEIEDMKNDVLYLNLQNLTAKIANENLAKIQSSKKIIVDLRGYPKRGEKTWQLLANNFFNDRNNVKFISSPKIQNPFYEDVVYTDFHGWNIKKNKDLTAKIVLLVYEGSGSFQESIPTYLKGNGYATIIGRTTGGMNGDRNDIHLLSGMTYSYTGLKVRNPDHSLFHTKGIVPDIFVEDNIEDIKNGKDTFIEKAIEYLNAE